jgi:hypothetical protein
MSDPQPSPPPLESERVLRHTWTRGFDEPEHVELLAQLGAVLADYARESNSWREGHDRGIVPDALAAIADDLDSLAGCLDEVAEDRAEAEDVHLCRKADTWVARVRGLVSEVRRAIGEEEESEGDSTAVEAEAQALARRALELRGPAFGWRESDYKTPEKWARALVSAARSVTVEERAVEIVAAALRGAASSKPE